MQIIIENEIKKLIPTDADKWLLNREDLEKPVEDKYYFKFAYLPPTATIEECEEKYIELEREKGV